MIRTNTAREYCHLWHGGQWSSLYQFGSSGELTPENYIHYIWEIMRSLQQEFFAQHPSILNKGELKQLNGLKEFFEHRIQLATGQTVTYKKHHQYGYLYPVLEGHILKLPI